MIEANEIGEDKGFSMVELVMLVGMIVIMMAISIPMLSSSMRDMQLVADARSIASTLTVAKLTATSQMTHCRLSFDLTNNEWQIEKLNRSNGQFELQQDTNQLSRGVANSGITFKTSSDSAPSGFPTSSSSAITFNSRGIPIDGAGVPTASNIIYLSKNPSDYAVSVSLAGKVQLWRLAEGQWSAQ